MSKEKNPTEIILEVRVTVKSKFTKIKKNDALNLEISLHAIPEKGEANKELIRFLSEFLNVAKSHIEIIKGLTSRNKLICIKCSTAEKSRIESQLDILNF